MRLSLGSSIDPKAISEGNDVYMDCEIRANPKAYKVEWSHNVRKKIHTLKKMKSIFNVFFAGVTSGVQSFIRRANFSRRQKSGIARHSKAPQWQLYLHCFQLGRGGHLEPCGHHCHV